MTDFIYSDAIRELADDYYNQRLTLEEYREQRKTLLDKIDEEYNGIVIVTEEDNQQDSGLFSKAVAFFSNKSMTNESE